MTRILYNRIAPVLANNSIITESNYASLPGGSCDPPITVLKAIINDANKQNKPLFILQQDISKAFDSIDTNILTLTMARLKIPHNFIKLILQLFSDRTNSVITAFGNMDPYEVQIEIDQGEVISPLLWTIYINPLLTVLNETNIAPY
jgi:hypothetical protein